MRPFLEGSAASVAAVLLSGTQRFFIVRYPVLPISKTVFSILVSQTLKSYLLNLAVYFEYFGFVVYTRMETKVEGKSTFRTVQGTDVCPVDC